MIKTIRLKEKKGGHKDHPIRLSTGAFTIFEQKTGLPAFITLSKGELLESSNNMQALIYGGIKMGYLWNDEECPLSFDEVGNLMDVRGIAKYLESAMESIIVDEDIEIEEKKTLKKVS